MSGAARATAGDAIPFLFEADHAPMVMVGEDGSKSIQCFAQISCAAASAHGLTELNMLDHDLVQKMDSVFWLLIGIFWWIG